MDPLFPGEPRELPQQHGSGFSITVTITAPARPTSPAVQHAIGYEPFLDFLRPFGITPEAMLDTWTFAHVVRAHREALAADPDLQRSAVVFLGNAFIREHPECRWRHPARGLVIETEGPRVEWRDGEPVEVAGQTSIGVERTVQALLDADEQRFREFAGVVDRWGPGSHGRPPPGVDRFDTATD